MKTEKVGRWSFVIRRRDNQQLVRTPAGNSCWGTEGTSKKSAESKALSEARKVAGASVYISGSDTENWAAFEIEQGD
jgi:hypothetical protein